MYISKTEYFKEVHVILQEDVDFTQSDLEGNALVGGRLKELTSEARAQIAFNLGYRGMTWAGHYDEKTKTVEATLRQPLFIDEENNCIIK